MGVFARREEVESMKKQLFGEFLEFGARMSNELMTRLSPEDKRFVLGVVSPKQLFVGGSFALLGVKVYEELGGRKHKEKVGPLGFLLSTVTKIDDEIIDKEGISPQEMDRVLENSRLALTEGKVVEDTPVTRIAKASYDLLMSCNPSEQALEVWRSTINEGWKVQRDSAVQKRSLTVTSEQIKDISARKGDTFIFGTIMPGLMPEDSKLLNSEEREAIRQWGYKASFIDNLVDIPKDISQGIVSEAVEEAMKKVPCMTDCVRNKRIHNILTCIRGMGIDKNYLMDEDDVQKLGEPLMKRLPGVQGILSWLYREWLKRYMVRNAGALGQVEEKVRVEIEGHRVSDIHHIYRTLNFAREIQREERGDLDIIEAAVWLHDIGREGASGAVAEGIGHSTGFSSRIQQILLDSGYGKEEADRIVEVVKEHSLFGDRKPSSIEAQILYDADKLDKLSVIGLVRGCMYLGSEGKQSVLDALMYAVLTLRSMSFHTETGKKLACEKLKESEMMLNWWMRDIEERDVPLGA